jgi:DNA-binding response OmpR family regulator
MAKLSGYRILYAEDGALIALDVADALESAGATVVGPASNVADATRLLVENIDCAVLDVNLGNESVAPLVRELEARRAPLVFTTGYEESDLPVLWRAWPIFRKPFLRVDLVDVIAQLVTSGKKSPSLRD